ncbi:hypothetical protein F1559_004572 [Cyanidiococcus yangmingshanensis]|uniref:Methyltransferase domain-containing protein n=1 Tax=Cyanidiococcus yangmingshanensis TaxID=2690220 RepID=A0A7J7IIE2_9RHOD|nr:hypothetical protein F1559_004572 [Cyanidiococcus yangmingshanensis]
MWVRVWYRNIGDRSLYGTCRPQSPIQRALVRRALAPLLCSQPQARRTLQLPRKPIPESKSRSQPGDFYPLASPPAAWRALGGGVNLLRYATGTAARSTFFLLFRLAMLQLVASGRGWSSVLQSREVATFSRDWRAQLEFVQFFLRELMKLSQKEWSHIQAGTYVMPRVPSRHPLELLPRSVDFLQNLQDSMKLRASGITDAVPETFHEDPLYPAYYKQNFHYQTDGYLSAASAERYDFQVEVLFGGLADMMRRQTLGPLLLFLRERVRSRRELNERALPLTVLNVPCGSGGFLMDLLDNLTADKELQDVCVTNLDLSPFYLQRAQARVQELTSSTATKHASFVHANAESLPFPNESFDAIVSIYLFHELPNEARRRVIAEWTRTLRPGGRIVFADSLQKGHNPALEAALDRFRVNYHEPYYQSFIETDLRRLFSEASDQQLVWREQDIHFLTKVCVFEKRVI